MGKADADGGVSYDPRLLAFEYAFNLLPHLHTAHNHAQTLFHRCHFGQPADGR